MSQDDAKAVKRLPRGLSLRVPNGSQHVTDVALVNFLHRDLAQLWQNVKLKGREPAARLSVAPQLGLADLEGFLCNLAQGIVSPRQFSSLALTFFDRVNTVRCQLSPMVRKSARLLQRHV
jgi:hypothetical protein